MTTNLRQSAWSCLQLMLACVIGGAFLWLSCGASCYRFCRCVLAWSEPCGSMTEQFWSLALLYWRFKNSVVVQDVPTNTFDTTTKKENRKIQFLESWFMDFRVFGFLIKVLFFWLLSDSKTNICLSAQIWPVSHNTIFKLSYLLPLEVSYFHTGKKNIKAIWKPHSSEISFLTNAGGHVFDTTNQKISKIAASFLPTTL